MRQPAVCPINNSYFGPLGRSLEFLLLQQAIEAARAAALALLAGWLTSWPASRPAALENTGTHNGALIGNLAARPCELQAASTSAPPKAHAELVRLPTLAVGSYQRPFRLQL